MAGGAVAYGATAPGGGMMGHRLERYTIPGMFALMGRTPAPHTCTPLTGGAQQRLLNDQVVTRWSIRWALARYGGHERLQLHVVEHLARPIMQLYKLFTALVCALRLRQAQPQPAGRLERLYDRAPTIAIDLEPPRDRLRLHCGDIHVRQRVRIGADHQRVVFEPRHDAA